MSGPASLFNTTLDPAASHIKDSYPDIPTGAAHTVCLEVTDTDGGDAAQSECSYSEQNVKWRGAAAAEQQEERPTVMPHPAEIPSGCSPLLGTSCDNHLSECINSSEDTSLDVLRVVKHKPSAIVFCDHEGSHLAAVSESSDGRESSSSSSTSKEASEDDDVDVFPGTLQYKKFLVSRHRRSLNKNRKFLRKRPEVLSHGAAADWQMTSINKARPDSASRMDEEDARQVNKNKRHFSFSIFFYCARSRVKL